MLSEDINKISSQKQSESLNISRLFSEQEINDIVKEFIRAYIKGQIKYEHDAGIIGVNKDPLLTEEMYRESQPLFHDIVKANNILLKLINICSGVENSTDEEYQNAIKDLFANIVILRMTKGISGSFFSNDIETQLKLVTNYLTQVTKDNEFYKDRINKVLEYVERLDYGKSAN
jgi:hypothetical protein